MDGSAAPRRPAPLGGQLSVEGLLDLDETISFGGEGLTSPLSLLSPNALRARPARSPAAKLGPTVDGLGELPRFGRRRPDPRRQSSAIFAGFAQATASTGLLQDDEIAVALQDDEDILISLPAAAKGQAAGAGGGHNTLWLEPHTDELLSGDLPEPDLPEPGLLGILAPIPESPTQPVFCSSPVRTTSPAKRGGSRAASRGASRGGSPHKLAGTGPAGGVRDSTTLSEGLSKLCLETGFDDWDTDDFKLQDGNKVKEMAILFKLDGDAKVASPRADAGGASHRAGAEAAAGAPSGVFNSGATSSSVKERTQRLQPAPPPPPEAVRRPVAPPPPAATSRPVASLPSTKAVGGVGTSSRGAAPAARPSRLKPPSTSSSFFSHAVTETRPDAPAALQQRARPGSAGRSSAAAGSRAAAAPALPRGTSAMWGQGAVASRTGPSAAPSSATTPSRAGAAVPLPSRPAPSPAHNALQPASRTASSKPVRSRLAQSSTSSAQAATPSRAATTSTAAGPQPVGAGPAAEPQRRGMFTQRTLGAAASRLRPPAAPSCSTPTHAGQQGAAAGGGSACKLPKLRLGSPAVSPSGDNLTPNTARIRYLEQHPELAFGGGSRVGNSPMGQQHEPVRRKKTAEERHLEEWGDHL